MAKVSPTRSFKGIYPVFNDLSQHPLKNELDMALRVAREAGPIALKYFKQSSTEKWLKADRSVVTEADKAVNEFLAKEILATYPGDALVGEESAAQAEADLLRHRLWLVDPIDGTAEFVKHRDEWSVQIGLVQDGRPVLGVVFQPTKNLCYFALRHGGAFFQEGEQPPVRMECAKNKSEDEVALIESRSRKDPLVDDFKEFQPPALSVQSGSVGLKLGLISSGKADLYLNSIGKCGLWDTAAPEIIIQEAGGFLLDCDLRPLSYQQSYVIEKPFVAGSENYLSLVREFLLQRSA